MVKSKKQVQNISKDGDFFLSPRKIFRKKYATPGGGMRCDPSQ